MKFIFQMVIVFLFVSAECTMRSSKYKQQEAVTQKLLKLIRERNLSAIKSLYGIDTKSIGLDDDGIISTIDAINRTIKRTSKVKLNYYQYNEYPPNSPKLVDIIIPLSNVDGCEEYIKVSFVKYIEKGKIYNFDLKKCINKDMDDLVAPNRLDSLEN